MTSEVHAGTFSAHKIPEGENQVCSTFDQDDKIMNDTNAVSCTYSFSGIKADYY